MTLQEIEDYDKREMLRKVLHYLRGEIKENQIHKILFVRSLRETNHTIILDRILQSINNENYFYLAFQRNQRGANLDFLDSNDVIYVADITYEIYLIIDLQGIFYFLIIEEYGFLREGSPNGKTFFKKVKRFNYLLYFFNSKTLYIKT